jgi:anhydro-N-acetylmuramic acid kinase
MSGTSLDGLDLALCQFTEMQGSYKHSILKAKTVSYSADWKRVLSELQASGAESYFKIHHHYGKSIASAITNFLKQVPEKPSAIASHGHTVFHQPHQGFSTQIGCGATIAANTGITTVCDFRSLDVALSGQGAPLVPIGDKLLFGQYKSCLNLGGIANISFDDEKNKRLAFDICVTNMALNYFAQRLGKNFDENGELSKQGSCDAKLLQTLNALSFYSSKHPKSIGREWFEINMLPLLLNAGITEKNVLNTLVEHISGQIAKILNENNLNNVLITGGGAFNTFLISKLKEKYKGEIHVPDAQTVNFKEALIFAFLGLLRLENKINTLNSVTGATRNSIAGAVYPGNS